MLNRRFLLTAIFLLGLLIITSLAVIVLILTAPQTELSAYQGATAASTPSSQSVEATLTPAATASPTGFRPLATSTPELETFPDFESVVDYREESTGAHRIIPYVGILDGTHRIVTYDGVAVEGRGGTVGPVDSAETARRGRIISYGTEE